MKKAIIDLGTNTFNLLVIEVNDKVQGRAPIDRLAPPFTILHEEEVPVFLGKGGLEKNRIAEDAFDRGIEALKELARVARSYDVQSITGIGCSTFRNSSNAGEFIAQASELGVSIEVIAGEEEAAIILDGVRLAVPLNARPALVMDIGGGSIEFILATEKALMWKQSFELGVTRLRERIPVNDPISIDEELRIAEHLDAHLEPLWPVIERHGPHLLIGSAGSFESLARMIAAARQEVLAPQERSFHFTASEFTELKDRVLRMDRNERETVPGLPAHRVETITYAMIAIERVLIAGEIRELAWSRYSLKEGAASRMINTGTQGNC